MNAFIYFQYYFWCIHWPFHLIAINWIYFIFWQFQSSIRFTVYVHICVLSVINLPKNEQSMQKKKTWQSIYFLFLVYSDNVVEVNLLEDDYHVDKNLIFWQLQMKPKCKWISFGFRSSVFFLEWEQESCDLQVEQQNMWAACCCRNTYYPSISSHRLSHRALSLSHIVTFIEKAFWHVRHGDVHIIRLWKHLPLHIIIRLPCWPAAACGRCLSPLCDAFVELE